MGDARRSVRELRQLVAEYSDATGIYVATALLGEIYMIAVDPIHQRRGIGTGLAQCALDWMKGAGITAAMVETGGDPGHAPARRRYERIGFRELPIARYFKKL
jgi:GNAT superfamily N-acetyltransferase